MRILYFTRDYTTHDRRFLLKLATDEHEILFLRLERDGNPYENQPLPPGVTGIEWEGGTRPAKQPEDWLHLMPAFQQVIEEQRPDIIQAGPVQSCGWMTALSGFHPFLLVSWGYDMLLDADQDPMRHWITRYTLQHADSFLCDSDAVREKSKPFREFSPEQVIQFPWGIELNRYPPPGKKKNIRRPLGWENHFVILSTRTWEPMYGIDILLQAFQQAYQRHPELRLMLLGSGSLKAEVEQWIQEHGLEEVIYCPGFVSSDTIIDYFLNADLYLSCTYCDGASISLLEAMACGLPVVVTDAFGNREWVKENSNGWLAKPGDPEDFCRCIVEAYPTPAERIRFIRENNIQTIQQRADWDQNIQKLLSFYHSR